MGPLEREFRAVFQRSTGFSVDDPRADPRKVSNSRATFLTGALTLFNLVSDCGSELEAEDLRAAIEIELTAFVESLGAQAKLN